MKPGTNPPKPKSEKPPTSTEPLPDDFSQAIAMFKGQLLVRMLQRQQKRLVLTGNSKDDCQQKQQSALHVEEATMDVIEIAQKMYEKIDCNRNHRVVVVESPLVKHLAEAVCNLAEQRHTLGFYELRGACKQLGHHRKESGSCVLASSARPQRSDNPSAQTGRAPHKAKEHIQKLKKMAKVSPLLRFTYPLYNDNTYAIGRTPNMFKVDGVACVMEDDGATLLNSGWSSNV